METCRGAFAVCAAAHWIAPSNTPPAAPNSKMMTNRIRTRDTGSPKSKLIKESEPRIIQITQAEINRAVAMAFRGANTASLRAIVKHAAPIYVAATATWESSRVNLGQDGR